MQAAAASRLNPRDHLSVTRVTGSCESAPRHIAQIGFFVENAGG
jgi:hypothetical protein